MTRFLLLIVSCLLPCLSSAGEGEVLIVADEIPAMELLAGKLKAEEKVTSQIVLQTAMPADLSGFSAVIVYIHKGLNEPAERAMIDYTNAGGKLVALHHSISSGKRKNKGWFPFLGVTLAEGDVNAGGYKWKEGVTLNIVNLAPDHFITSHKVQYPANFRFALGAEPEKQVPGFTLEDSEVYLNHVLTGPHTLLLGLRYTDETGKVWMQGHAGWVRPSGKGWIIYLMSGHSARDFENPAYARIVTNAVAWKP